MTFDSAHGEAREGARLADYDDLLRRMRDSLAAYGLIENGDLREAIDAIESLRHELPLQNDANDMLAAERDSWCDRARRAEADTQSAFDLSRECRERATKAEAERDALRQDALRYWWIRDCAWGFYGHISLLPSDQMDAAIDAAMAGKDSHD